MTSLIRIPIIELSLMSYRIQSGLLDAIQLLGINKIVMTGAMTPMMEMGMARMLRELHSELEVVNGRIKDMHRAHILSILRS
jgi:hypothetical protein